MGLNVSELALMIGSGSLPESVSLLKVKVPLTGFLSGKSYDEVCAEGVTTASFHSRPIGC